MAGLPERTAPFAIFWASALALAIIAMSLVWIVPALTR